MIPFLSSRLEATIGGFTLLSKLHSDISMSGPGRVEVDFSWVNWIDAHLASSLRVLVELAMARGQTILFMNLKPTVSAILRKNGFLEGTLRDTYSTTIPCTVFGEDEGKEFADFARRYLNHHSMPSMTDTLQRKFFEGVDEIFANSSLHSESSVPIAVCGQFFPRQKRLTFVISDGGRGMRGAYSKWSGQDIGASEAINWAMQPNSTTRIGDIPGGLGLALIREFVALNGGRLVVASEAGYWCQDGPQVTMTDMASSFPGTSIVLEIDCTDVNQYDVNKNANPNDIW